MPPFKLRFRRAAIATLVAAGAITAAPVMAGTYQLRQFVPGLVAAPSVPAAPVVVQGSTAALTLAPATLPAAKLDTAYSYDFTPLLTATGDPAYAANQVVWSATGLPAGLNFSNGVLTGTPSTVGGSSVVVTAAFKDKSVSQTYSMEVSLYTSCKTYLDAHPGAASGNYTLDADGAGAGLAMSYYCDMTSNGGGWTKIVQQYSTTPVTTWAGGTNGSSFTLAQAKIPAHTQVAFGKDNVATFIDYVNFTYTTGDIPTKTLAGLKNVGTSYQINRAAGSFFNDHDPEKTYGGGSAYWVNTLTFDKVGGTFTWAYAPTASAAGGYGVNAPGFAMNGTMTYQTSVSYAWTVWVR